MDSTDLLYAFARSVAIVFVGTALGMWVFKRGTERVMIFWAVVAGSVLSFLPLPRHVLAIPTRLEIPEAKVYDSNLAQASFSYVEQGVSIWAYIPVVLLSAGALLFALRMYLTWRYIRRSEQISSPNVLAETADIGSAVGVKEIPLVMTSNQTDSAYATGLLNPAIVLPRKSIEEAPEDQRRAILCHEMLHIRRKDHWFVALVDLWFCMFFWNPVAWIGRNLAFNAMEEANDHRTIDSGLVDRAAYLRALLSGTHPMVAAPIARFHGQSSLRARIEAIANGERRKTSLWAYVAATFIVLLAYPVQVESMPSVPTSPGQVGVDEVIYSSSFEGRSMPMRVRLDGSGKRFLNPALRGYGQLTVSPDCSKVAYIKGPSMRADVFIANFDGTDELLIAGSDADDVQPQFSPDGTKICYISKRTGKWQIYIYDIAARTTTPFSDPRYKELEAHWHPNGKRLIFSSDQSLQQKIWSRNLDGTDPMQISQGTTFETGGIYSRDGRYAIYMSSRDGGFDLFRMDLVTGQELRLTDAVGDDGEAVVSADNRWIFYTTTHNRSVVVARMRLDGTGKRIIASNPGGVWPQVRIPSGPSQPAR